MNKVTLFFTATILAAIPGLAGCQANTVPESDAEQNLILGLASGQVLEAGKDFALNGQWNAFTGSGTTSDTITTITAKAGTGVWLDDSSGFGGYSACYVVTSYSNGTGYVITRNPPNHGSCPDGFTDSNIGKYNKVVFFSDTYNDKPVFWFCSVAFGQNSEAEAVAAEDTADRSDPTAANTCGSSPWSRLERR